MESSFRQFVLYPSDQEWLPASAAALAASLQRMGMLGQALDERTPDRFLIGEAFLQLFSFMGCAPSIEFEPKQLPVLDWQAFVFIQLSPAQSSPRWLVDKQNAKPACPHCQRRSREWQQHIQTGERLHCPRCGKTEPVCHWRWYDSGGCARQFVSIVNVYPKESLPTDTLLSQLQDETGVAWQYFYLHAPLLNG